MPPGLAFGIGLAVAVIGGIALWPSQNHAALAAPRPAIAAAAPRCGPPGSEEVLARALLALLPDDQQRLAVVGREAGTEPCLGRSVPPSAITTGRGILAAELGPAGREVLWRLLEHCSAASHAERAPTELERVRRAWPGDIAFAFAGGPALGDPCYVRVHGTHFVVEWVRTAAGQVAQCWRDFERDAHEPWLRDRLQAPAPAPSPR
ncbi:MAG: DUF3500 domain-containing protein [Planctomycetes bacterium]|jgi:hypothetical protein|nr:DUF3500 domain-containing protein [Planctomycetota bacterium]